MSELYRERVENVFKNPNFAAAKPDERQAIKIMKDILASKPFEQSLKNANIEILEDFMEKIAAAGNKSSAFSLLINQHFQELIDDFNRIEKAIADSAEGLGKIAGKLNFFAKHLGPVASAIDLGVAIHSDDANAVIKAATVTSVGMLITALGAAASAPAIGVALTVAAFTTAVAIAWDHLKVGEMLGLVGKNFSELTSEAIDAALELSVKFFMTSTEITKFIAEKIEEFAEELIEDIANKTSEIIDTLTETDWTYLDDFILDLGKKFWNKLTGKEGIDEYAKLNRTGKYQAYDPLSLDLDGDGIETTAIEGLNSTLFDHNKDGIRTATGWVSADDGLLVLDRNGDGVINHGGELFGDNTLLKDGSLAANGFAALAEHDENGDGKIDAQDAVFHQLKVWRDLNQDGISQEGELFTLEQLGIQSLDLNHQAVNQRQGNGNSVARLGSYTDSEGKEHLMGDLLFDSNPMISRFTDKIALSAEQRQAPNLRGMGRLRDLQEAAALSEQLAESLKAYSEADSKEAQMALLTRLIAQWSDTDPNQINIDDIKLSNDLVISNRSEGSIALTPTQIAALRKGMTLDVQTQADFEAARAKIAILNAFTGESSHTLYFGTAAQARHIIDTVNKAFDSLSEHVYQGLLFQTRLKPYLNELSFKFENSEFVLDYAAVEMRFKQVFAENPQKTFIDLGELLAFANIKDWHQGMALLSDFAHQGKENGQLQDWLAILGERAISALSEQNGDEMSNILRAVGLLGRDVLNGNGGDDHLIIGSATAVVDGGSGSDLYEFYQGFGMTTVHNHDTSDNRFDVIRLHGVSKDAVSYTREGDDLIIRVAGEANSITVAKMFAGDVLSRHIDAIEYEGGQITLAEIKETLLRGTDGNDVLLGYGDDDTVYAGAGDDRIRTFAGNDTIYAGAGNDDIDAGNGNDIIYLEAGNNRAYGGDDDDVIYSGSGNDHLEGGIGSDTYVFAKQFAQDVVLNFNPRQQDNDVLKFTHAKLNVVRIYRHESDLLIAQNDGQQVSVQNFFDQDGKGDYTVQELQFADGNTLNTEQLRQWVISPTRGDDRIYAYAEGDKLYGGNGNDTLIGNQGSDYLAGGNGNDTLMGGKGDDRLEGGMGNDTYLFNLGDGKNRIYDSFGNDVLQLGKDIAKQDLWFTRIGSDLSIQILGKNDSITVENWFNFIPRQIESIQTHDGAQIHVAAVNHLVRAMAAFVPEQGNSLSMPEQMREYSKQLLAGHQFWQHQDTTAAFVI